MIATVTQTTGAQPLEESRKLAEDLCPRVAAADGCGGMLLLHDGSDLLAVTLWRDAEALKAFQAQRRLIVNEAQDRSGGNVGEDRVFEVVYRTE